MEVQDSDSDAEGVAFKGPGPARRRLWPLRVLDSVRARAAEVVENRWFDRFILFLILLNSVLLMFYQYTDPDHTFNKVSDQVIDPILLVFFTLECVLKILAWGLLWRVKPQYAAYLFDAWNWLDLVVVVTGWIGFFADGGSLSFLRVFRILRPLRSLTMLPEMRVLVNTVLQSIPRLFDVTLMALFLFTVFAIIGVTLWHGVFYRSCRTTPNPVLSASGDCWDWPSSEQRLCGGRNMCQSGERCGGHIDDTSTEFRPVFEGGHRNLPWCDGYRPIDEPKKVFPETDFIHFDHIGGAMLLVFQSMTMEGWTDVMYMVQDGSSLYVATVYFVLVILVTSFFVLNVILAVIAESYTELSAEVCMPGEADEGRELVRKKSSRRDLGSSIMLTNPEPAAEENDASKAPEQPVVEQTTSQPEAGVELAAETLVKTIEHDHPEVLHEHDSQQEFWCDRAVVRVAFFIADSEVCKFIVMFFIAANVVVMMLEKFPPDLQFQAFIKVSMYVFTIVFAAEMVLMLVAHGPIVYVTDPLMCFDGIIVLASFVELMLSESSALTVFRTFKLLRVLFKLANKWEAFRVLLKSMVMTVRKLGYFALLFILVLYVCTLMGMTFFSTRFHFNEDHSELLDDGIAESKDKAFCTGPGFNGTRNMDCVPRAHFDTFLWGMTTIFQIMSGENWNMVMYDGIRSRGWVWGSAFFIFMIVFGQTLMLNLFLTILMAKFEEASFSLKEEEREKRELAKQKRRALRLKQLESGMFHKEYDKKKKEKRSKVAPEGETTGEPQDQVEPPSGETKSLEVVQLPGQIVGSPRPAEMPMQPQLTEDTEELQTKPLMEANFVTTPPPVSSPESKVAFNDALEVPPPAPAPGASASDVVNKNHAPPAGPAPSASMAMSSTAKASVMSEFDSVAPKPARKEWPDRWPYNHAFFLFHRTNPVRRLCGAIVEHTVFDNFILLCIVLSSICMAIDTPLRDPDEVLTKVLRTLDRIFAVIFMAEMVMKLIAKGLFLGPDTYLQSPWNWLDGTVVAVSVVDMASESSAGFLKTLRILRAFRPLRVIARAPTLKVVVKSIFRSLPELFTLFIVSMLFLLIIGLLTLAYFNGRLSACTEEGGPGMALLDNMGDDFTTPLCVGSHNQSVCARGSYDGINWIDPSGGCSSCGSQRSEWRRPSADTPICVGRCSPLKRLTQTPAPEDVCPKALEKAEELPSVCGDGSLVLEPQPGPYYEDEVRGIRYVEAMLQERVMPCGAPEGVAATRENSCRALFCPSRMGTSESCKSDCESHPTFCKSTCRDFRDGGEKTAECQACLTQCEAWCECEDFCEPLVQDAALCVEQGARWVSVVSQNFNNIFNAMTTLFELSTTEGWVDVMYAAVDSRGEYRQPKRDDGVIYPGNLFWIMYIFFSNMFIINLSVGVIVDCYITISKEQAQSKDDSGVTSSKEREQQKERWWLLQWSLYSRPNLFQVTNLHMKPNGQRKVYYFVTSSFFENTIMVAIVLNTLIMAMYSFPLPTEWWTDFIQSANYTFGVIFFFEFVLKLYALRVNYWRDSWNCFDCFCVMATIIGFVVKMSSDANIGTIVSVIRIFRVARLFRLLRFMKGMNKIFMALLYSVPKLGSVSIILVLLLILYAILGVQLFATIKYSETLGVYGNFRNFYWAFMTLFRSMTGEAWNEIMHDLSKDEAGFLRGPRIDDGQDWCSPPSLFDVKGSYSVLKDKCLIEYPNSCGDAVWPKLYFVSYTLVISFIVLNLVIAVILDGYQDGKEQDNVEIIDTCIRTWSKYDPNFTMSVHFWDAYRYAEEVLASMNVYVPNDLSCPRLRKVDTGFQGLDIAMMPMKFASNFDLVMTEEGNVHFIYVVELVIQTLVCGNDPVILRELQEESNLISRKNKEKLKRAQSRQIQKNGAVIKHGMNLRQQVAATKIQRKVKVLLKEKRRRRSLLKHAHDNMVAESVSGGEGGGRASSGTATELEEHVEPTRSPAVWDGIDELAPQAGGREDGRRGGIGGRPGEDQPDGPREAGWDDHHPGGAALPEDGARDPLGLSQPDAG